MRWAGPLAGHADAAPSRGPSSSRAARLTSRPALLVIGEPARVQPVYAQLGELDVERRRARWRASLTSTLPLDVLAVVLVEPLPRVPTRIAVALLRSEVQRPNLAVVAVVPDKATDAHVRVLYDRGATRVLFWPRDRERLARNVADASAALRARGGFGQADEALARAVRARLRLEPAVGAAVRVRVARGVATLTGEVPLLWSKERAITIAASVAGITRVVARDLRVARGDVSDEDLRGRVRTALRRTLGPDATTLVVGVAGGYVTLAGSAANQDRLAAARRALGRVPGVRAVDPWAVVSKPQQRRDKAASDRLQRALRERFDEPDLTVRCFGPVAEFSGQVRTVTHKRAIRRALERDDAVERVIDKADVVAS